MTALRIRFTFRRALANLSRFPEGYEIQFQIPGGHRAITILTPPDLVAVQRQDGTWFRRVRNVTEDGPPPYTEEWYQEYLRTYDLPHYFLRPEHLQMLQGNAEAENLGMNNSLPLLAQPIQTHMAQRYPRPVQYLLPDADVATQATPVDLSRSQQERLGFRFPGTTVNATMFNSYRVYVLPSGHITLRYHRTPGTAGNVAVNQDQLRAVDETASTYLASYRIQGGRMGLTAGSTCNRTQERSDAEQDGGLVDWNEQPNGVGTWRWLNRDVDPEIAIQYGLNTPEDVMRARQNGVLTNVPYNHRPLTVWYPDTRFVNPQVQPEGQGRWEYTTTPSQDLAWTNHGLQENFPNEPHPTAAQIWDLRRRQRDEIARGDRDEDTTADIDLVWVPEVPDNTPGRSQTPLIDPDVTDAKSGLNHQPKNRNENDQTGVPGERKYQTIKIQGKVYTVDRSRAHANVIQKWKSYALTKKGVWYQWRQYRNINWADPNSVEKLNKWREQALKRAGFPDKREETREPYTEDQLDWLFEYVKRANGERPNITMDELARRFNAQFPNQNRRTLGIQSVYDRLRGEWRDNDGQRKPRTHRTRRQSSQATPTTEPEPEDSNNDNTGPVYGDEDEVFDDDEFQE